ncbi:MAG: hypothetical protein R3E95_17920 [Thiolinea sp.]
MHHKAGSACSWEPWPEKVKTKCGVLRPGLGEVLLETLDDIGFGGLFTEQGQALAGGEIVAAGEHVLQKRGIIFYNRRANGYWGDW